MSGDDFPTPDRREARGQFPDHPPPPRDFRVLTGPEALAVARKHLADWIRDHGEARRGD